MTFSVPSPSSRPLLDFARRGLFGNGVFSERSFSWGSTSADKKLPRKSDSKTSKKNKTKNPKKKRKKKKTCPNKFSRPDSCSVDFGRKAPKLGFEFCCGFSGGFFLLFVPRKKVQKKPPKNPPQKSPGIFCRKNFPRISAEAFSRIILSLVELSKILSLAICQTFLRPISRTHQILKISLHHRESAGIDMLAFSRDAGDLRSSRDSQKSPMAWKQGGIRPFIAELRDIYPLTQNYYLRTIILKEFFLKNCEFHASRRNFLEKVILSQRFRGCKNPLKKITNYFRTNFVSEGRDSRDPLERQDPLCNEPSFCSR